MKKIILKKRKKKKLKITNLILLIIILLILITHKTINYVNKNISPKLKNYAELELKKISSIIITESINIDDLEKLNVNEICIITKNEKNEILTVDINTVILNKIIRNATTNIQEKLKKLELGIIDENNRKNKNGVVLEIPSGEIYNNFLFNNLVPKIPVKIKILGDMKTKINSNIKNYGINNALIEISLDITVTEKVILPISTSEINVTQTIPITIKLVTGTVPNYYSNGINKSETFSIPIE